MNKIEQQKRFITRYLLRQVTAQERSDFERQYLADGDVFEELVNTEEEMIHAYVHGQLAENELRDFGDHFFTVPERAERIRLARSLLAYSSNGEMQRTHAPTIRQNLQEERQARPVFLNWITPWRTAVAALLLALVSIGSWIAMDNYRLHRKQEPAQALQAQTKLQEHESQNQPFKDLRISANQESHPIAPSPETRKALIDGLESLARLHMPPTVTLTSANTRDGGGQTAKSLPKAGLFPERVRLILRQDEYATYEVLLETADGTEIWHKPSLKSSQYQLSQRVIFVTLPAKVFPKGDRRIGDYALRVIGLTASKRVEEVGTYPFRVSHIEKAIR